MTGELDALVSAVESAWRSLAAEHERRASGRAVSPGGEVAVSVDACGDLVSLRLKPGTVSEIPYQSLASLINETIAEATRRALPLELARVS